MEFSAKIEDQFGHDIENSHVQWKVSAGGGSFPSGYWLEEAVFVGGAEAGTYQETVELTATLGDVTLRETATVIVRPMPQGKIVYHGRHVHHAEHGGPGMLEHAFYIALVDLSGSGKYLIDNDDTNVWPAWSPDGDKVAFTSFMDGQPDIYVVSSSGEDLIRLTENSDFEIGVQWSPDGQQLAFAVFDPEPNRGIYVLKVQSALLKRLTVPGEDQLDSSPVWLGQEERLMFNRVKAKSEEDLHSDVMAVNLAGGDVTIVATGEPVVQVLDWSAPRQRLLLTRVSEPTASDPIGMELFEMDLTTGVEIQLTHTPDFEELNGSYSPDGNFIVYSDDSKILLMRIGDANGSYLESTSILSYVAPDWGPPSP